MSLKKFFIGVTVAFFVLVTCMATAILNASARLETTATEIVNRAESIQASEELEVHLLSYGRDSRLYDLTGDEVYKNSIAAEEKNMATWLARSRSLVATEQERQIVDQLKVSIDRYLKSRNKNYAKKVPSHRVSLFASKEFDIVYYETEKLTEMNLAQARALEAQAVRSRDMASSFSLIFVLAALGLLAYLAFTVRHWIIRPTVQLLATIKNFSSDKGAPRAPETGPLEIAEVGKAFNKLADALSDQKETRVKFLASVAHDIRNPLGAIRMSAQILTTDDVSREEQLPMIQIIARQAAHLDRLVGDLLDATRIESGHLDLQKKKVSLHGLVEDAVSLHRAVSPNHLLHFKKQDGVFVLDGDGVRLSQVLNNLISNAIKYSPEGGRVDIELERKKDHAVLKIHDQGIGISVDDQPHIFEPFRRTARTKSTIPGVGLGLSITKKIIEAHNGRIWVESTQGQGSTFFVLIPLSDVAAEQAVPKPQLPDLDL